MLKGFSTLFVILILVSMLSCADDDEVDCTTALPAPDWFELGFFNSQGQALIGSVYLQEEFRVFNSTSETFISPMASGDQTRLQVRFPDFETNVDYFIELTSVDTDTLRFLFETSQGPCFLSYDLQQVIFNGETIMVQNTNRVDLIK
ncbi:MAG: hypothetical protein HKO94_01755 [Flavobacteriaceae bacterium]|nr:hypothetical protein [Flavobacteriaceae bacterium]